MSNITLFNAPTTTDLSYLAGITDSVSAKLAGSAGGKRLSIRGGVFRMMSQGQEVAKSPDRHLNVVVIDASPHISRTYYKGTYQEGVNVPPTCWSDDGVKPDAAVPMKPCATCMECPMNIKGSGQGESKACRFSQRLAVVLADNIEGDVYGLTLAATSLFGKGTDTAMPLQQYTRKLKGHGMPINAVVTKINFDLDSATPKLVFSAERPLSEAEYKAAALQAAGTDAKDAIAPINYSGQAAPVVLVQAVPAIEAPLFNQPVVATPSEAIPEPTVRAKPTQTPEVGKTDIDQILTDWA
jgi:hypothetical protein